MIRRTHFPIAVSLLALAMASAAASAEPGLGDKIGDLIAQAASAAVATPDTPAPTASEPADPRAGDKIYEQSRALMQAINAVLEDAAENRSGVAKLPSKNDYLVTPPWTETREDRQTKVRSLLDSALGIVTDVPVVEVQKRIEENRRTIKTLEDRIASLKEKQVLAPKDGTLPGVLTDTVTSLDGDIASTSATIETKRAEILKAKDEVRSGLAATGIDLSPDQLDLLLDSVLSGDLVRLIATFNAAKLIDGQLERLMMAAGDNASAARKYFAMHAALFAMLVHAQDSAIAKIDTQYLPKLEAILKDIAAAKSKTAELTRVDNRPDQKRALEANRDSQKIAEDAAKSYRRYLQQQREAIAKARARAAHDLKIADNTFQTVEASFELQSLMRESAASFEALEKIEAPTFEQIFKNEALRREFESLTRKLDSPTS